MNAKELVHWLDQSLTPEQFKDYCPNGLQVDGDSREIKRVALAVSLTTEVIINAINQKADLLLTHHGFFWDHQPFVATGSNREKLKLLLESGVALASYHLPLDYHQTLGNHVKLAQVIGLENIQTTGPTSQPTGFAFGTPTSPSFATLINHLTGIIGTPPRVASFGADQINKVMIATGGAQKEFAQAVALGADVFLTGEGSEQNYTEAQDLGCHFVALGHSWSEQFGVKALGEELAQQLGIESFFIKTENPF